MTYFHKLTTIFNTKPNKSIDGDLQCHEMAQTAQKTTYDNLSPKDKLEIKNDNCVRMEHVMYEIRFIQRLAKKSSYKELLEDELTREAIVKKIINISGLLIRISSSGDQESIDAISIDTRKQIIGASKFYLYNPAMQLDNAKIEFLINNVLSKLKNDMLHYLKTNWYE